MNYQNIDHKKAKELLEYKKAQYMDLSYYAWPQTFGSTCGPRGGIGGQEMSTFTVEAFVCDDMGPTIYLCNGCYYFEDEPFKPFRQIYKWRQYS